MAYLYLGKPLFDVYEGENDLDFLSQIFELRGTPDEETWPGCQKLPQFKEYSQSRAKPISTMIYNLPEDGEKLL